MYVCMYRFGGTSTRAYPRTEARGATPELRRVADTTILRLVRRQAFHTDVGLRVNPTKRDIWLWFGLTLSPGRAPSVPPVGQRYILFYYARLHMHRSTTDMCYVDIEIH